MLEQELVALAAAGGTALVQAAGTDAWAGLRQAMAQWFGRGDEQCRHEELERLDRTAAELAATQDAGDADAERARTRHEAVWQSRIEDLLGELREEERDGAADAMRDLLQRYAPRGAVAADTGGIAVRGDFRIQADRGSVAFGIANGDVSISSPPAPDPTQG